MDTGSKFRLRFRGSYGYLDLNIKNLKSFLYSISCVNICRHLQKKEEAKENNFVNGTMLGFSFNENTKRLSGGRASVTKLYKDIETCSLVSTPSLLGPYWIPGQKIMYYWSALPILRSGELAKITPLIANKISRKTYLMFFKSISYGFSYFIAFSLSCVAKRSRISVIG
uniref:Uncharacterized protein n=1 Tax=Strigamia maritima TaxID=126957 RepID=T1JH88_STRMM